MAQTRKSRNYVFTLNNYSEEEIERLRSNSGLCRYIVWGKEVAPTTGTPHLQGFLAFDNARARSAVSALLPDRAWFEAAKGTAAQAMEYSKKEGNFEEHGDPPMDQKRKGEASAERWEAARKAAQSGDFDAIPADIYMRCYNTVKRIRQDTLLAGEQADTEVEMEWYWGESGSGKSRKARSENPGAYLKMCNKWWDGYSGQNVVLIEDFDQAHKVLCHHLKIWADRYPFPAEVKGGSIQIRPTKIIVTSNYHPREIWDSNADLQPILRRFKCTEFKVLAHSG